MALGRPARIPDRQRCACEAAPSANLLTNTPINPPTDLPSAGGMLQCEMSASQAIGRLARRPDPSPSSIAAVRPAGEATLTCAEGRPLRMAERGASLVYPASGYGLHRLGRPVGGLYTLGAQTLISIWQSIPSPKASNLFDETESPLPGSRFASSL